jgi:2-polyprenyl-3-methyl-5-hydroxy-6-metoxy-1,4-benzoquinol methylase
MTPGQVVRKLAGPRLFKPLGRAYRSIFVDLERVVDSVPPLSPGSHILDVGGGDGQVINRLLLRNREVRATMIDIGTQLGGALDPEVQERVEVLPGTSLRDYAARGQSKPDLVMVCDVVHHVPTTMRRGFFEDLALVVGPETRLLIKDINPGTPRALLSYLADRYVSGDKSVQLVSDREIEALVRDSLPQLRAHPTELLRWDAPNYAIVFAAG